MIRLAQNGYQQRDDVKVVFDFGYTNTGNCLTK
jgi:hypothetical protein